jgi:hypothetical protein
MDQTKETFPAPLFCFARKGLQQQLASMSNLCRWGKSTSSTCPLCKNVQTNKHILSNCSAPVALRRYKLRHDAVLYILCNWLKSVILSGAMLHADIDGFEPLGSLFNSLCPDIAVIINRTVYLCELTVCHETNELKSREYKRNKCASIQHDLTDKFKHYSVKLETIECSVFGFMSDCSTFTKLVTELLLPKTVYDNLIRNVIGNSYNIYLNRNNST